ncbi:DNA methylase N-4 [Paludibacter sp. 221]|uniref:DNA modification methylase n=1 Tax=Paludibacter sp. 221 TaxID=2302939 RepID=UPI0013D86C03|nr:DNA modification methylase [Paludibacter sp. 221]NDV45811.1 DNA methylase N-4 [Paludibacter sp. 221]
MRLVWTTEKRTVKELIPTDYNPRIRNEVKQKKLNESIDKFDLVEIPVINLDNHIIAGQRRWEVYMESGRENESIDVRVPNRMLTKQEVDEYMLISNTHAGEWSLPMLEEHFSGLYKDIVLDLPSVSTDLPSEEMLNIEKDAKREIIDDEFNDLPTQNKEPLTHLNDLYELGEHRLLCGNSEDINAYGRLMAGALAVMVFTDPPYNLKPSDFSGFGKNKATGFVMGAGEMSQIEFIRFLENIFENLISYSKKGSIHYICMDWKHIYEIIVAGKKYTELKNLIVWNKDNGGMGTFYRSKHELIFMFGNSDNVSDQELDNRLDTIEKHGYEDGHSLIYAFKNGNTKHINNFMLGQTGRYRTNVWNYPGANSFSSSSDVTTKDHPTPKPVKLVADAIMDCSNIGDIVLDNFNGSGTTIIASEQTERKCYAIDLDPKYCDLTIKRYLRFMKFTGSKIVIKKNGVVLTKKELEEYELQ